MDNAAAQALRDVVGEVYRSDSRRVLATLIRLLGDFDLAEEALHDARRAARTAADGELTLLEDQDRSLWDRARIAEGCVLVERALGLAKQEPERRFLERRLRELAGK